MNNQDNETLYNDWVKWQKKKKFLKISGAAIVLALAILLTCSMAHGQERAVLVSSQKIKLSTKVLVCVESESGRRYTIKFDTHCWRCKVVDVPAKWDVVVKRKRVFIKPVL